MMAVKDWVSRIHTLGWSGTDIFFNQLNHLGQKTEIQRQKFEKFFWFKIRHFIQSSTNLVFYPSACVFKLSLGHVWLYLIHAEADRAFVT